jgi:hypothetical protein
MDCGSHPFQMTAFILAKSLETRYTISLRYLKNFPFFKTPQP